MLSKKLRLNLAQARWRYSGADVQVSGNLFKLLGKRRAGNENRFGFLVSGKVGKAVVRNQAKRLLTECVQKKLGDFPVGFDYVFVAYPILAQKNYEEICSSLDKVLPKIPIS